MVKCPAGNRQQQAADDESPAGAKAIRRQPGEQTADAQHNRGDAIGLQGNRRREAIVFLQPDRRHQDHHHHACRQQPGQQHRDHHRLLVLQRYRFYRQLLRQRFTLLHLKKNRRLLQPATQIHRNQTKYTAQQEGDPPAAVVDPLRRQAGVDKRRHHRPQQNANRQAGRQSTAGDTNAFFRDMLGDKHPGARNFPADRRPLQNTHQQ